MHDDSTDPQSTALPQLKNSGHLLFFLVVAVAALLVVLNVAYLWMQTSNPGETSNPESLFIYHAVNLSEGKALYTDFRKPPYNVTQYTPLFYQSLSFVKQIFELKPEQLFMWGRRLTLLFAFGIAFMVFIHGKKAVENNLYPLTAASVFLGCYVLWPLACTNRSDMPGAFFSVAALTIFTAKKNNYWLALPLLVLAFYTKQSFLSAPAAIAVYFLVHKKFSRFFQFAAVFAVVVGLIWFWLHQISDGMSTLNLVEANIAPMSFRNVRLVAGLFLQTAALPLILSFSGLNSKWRDDPVSIYFITSLILAVFTSAKLGSSMNYFLEPLAAGCLLIPAAFKRAMDSAEWSRAILVAIFVVLTIPQISFLVHAINTLQFRGDESARKIASSADGLVISDNPRISISSRTPFMIDPFAYSYLERSGKWDSSEVISMIKDGKIQYLILLAPLERPLTWQGTTRLPRSIIQVCSKEFKQTGIVDNYFIYEQK